MDEPNVLVPDDLDLVNETKAAQLVAELLLRHALVKSTEVDIPAGIALADGQSNLSRDRRGLAPANLQLLPVQRQFLDSGVGVEGSGGSTVKEGKEDAGLLGQNPDRLQRAEVDEVKQLVDGSSRREVADIHRAAGRI